LHLTSYTLFPLLNRKLRTTLEKLTESLFYGTWRSYKAFLQSGNIINHTKENYQEFTFTQEKQLTITAYDNGQRKMLDHAEDWMILFKDKRHYLSIDGKRLAYEVITINHTALVLLHIQSRIKFFCALPETWDHYVNSATSLVL
jgi:hypothetical protein